MPSRNFTATPDGAKSDDSTQITVEAIRRGDDAAVAHLWQRWSVRLVEFFVRWFGKRPRPFADEDDLAQETFISVVQYIRAKPGLDVTSRAQLWRLFAAVGIHDL